MLAQKIYEPVRESMSQTPPALSDSDRHIEIANKIGTFRFDRELSVKFPHGMIGFPDAIEFGVADLPESLQQFKLLQCLTEPGLSFIVLPMDLDKAPIDSEDLKNAAEVLGIALADLAVLFVITIRALGPGQGISMSVNNAAPVLVDTNRRIGRQFVFSNNKYQVQQQIG